MTPRGRRTIAFAISALAALFCCGAGERSGAVFNGSSLTLATSDSSYFFFQGVRYRVAYFRWSAIDSQVTLDGRVQTAALSPDGEIRYSSFASRDQYTAHCESHDHEKAMSYLRNIASFFSNDDGTPRVFIIRTGGDFATFQGRRVRAIVRQIERAQRSGKVQDGPLSEDWLRDFRHSTRHVK